MSENYGTFIMAMHYEDGIYCCTDSKVTRSVLGDNDTWNKVTDYKLNGKFLALDGGSFMLFSGEAIRIDELLETLQPRIAAHRTRTGNPMDVSQIAKEACGILDSHEGYMKPIVFAGIFCGYSRDDNVHQIYTIETKEDAPTFACLQDRFAILGSGSNVIDYSDIQMPLDPETIISEEQARMICLRTAKLAKAWDERCGGDTWVVRINGHNTHGPEIGEDININTTSFMLTTEEADDD